MELFENQNPEISRKYQSLKEYFKPYTAIGICIAYSGGVDSTLLLKAAIDAADAGNDIAGNRVITAGNDIAGDRTIDAGDDIAGDRTTAASGPSDRSVGLPVLAVILETQLHPHSDTEHACRMAESLGAQPLVIQVDEFQNPEILQNPVNRCYLCKHLLFSQLKELAVSRGYHAIFDGTNKDDESEYRPGMKVLQELQIKSPLRELGITKADVRAVSSMLGLSTASVPSTPCLATRLPYGAYLDRGLLERIHKGETLLREMGFYNVRLRFHEPVLRLETDCDSFDRLIKQRNEIVPQLKALGFPYITLDLEGFRSGSMDIHVSK